MSAVYHPHSNVISCGFASGVVRVFDVDTAEVICTRQQHSAPVSCVLFSPGGELLYSCGEDGLLVRYDVLQGYAPTRVLHIAQAGHVCMSMSEDGSRLAYVGPTRHVIRVVDGVTLDEVGAFDMKPTGLQSDDFAIDHLAYSRGGGSLFATTACGRLIRMNSESGNLEAEILRAHSKRITCLAVHPKDWYIVTGSEDSTVSLWDPTLLSTSVSQSFSGHDGPVRCALFSNTGTTLMTGAEATFLWDVSPPQGSDADNRSVKSSQERENDDRHVHFAESDAAEGSVPSAPSQVARAEVPTERTSPVDEPQRPPQEVAEEAPRRAAIHPADFDPAPLSRTGPPSVVSHYGGALPTTPQADQVFAADSAQQVVSLESTVGITPRGRKNALWHDRVGIFVFSSGSRVVIEDLDTRDQQHLVQHASEVSTLAITTAGDLLASACGPTELTERLSQICLWDTATGACRERLLYHVGDVGCLLFSSDDRR